MINVISLFGGQKLQEGIIKELEKSEVRFVCPDCDNEMLLLNVIESHGEYVDVIIIHNNMIHSNSIELIICELRRFAPDARIITILSGKRSQFSSAQLKGFCRQNNITDIIFDDSPNCFQELTEMIIKGRVTGSKPDNAKEEPVAPSFSKEVKEPKKTIVTKDNKNVPSATPMSDSPENADDCNSIAIFGAAPGTGATTMAVTLAEYFAMMGKDVTFAELSSKSPINFRKNITHTTINRLDLDNPSADISILDFGTPFGISPKGVFLGITFGYPTDIISKLHRCNLKIVMCFSAGWQIKKAEFFLKNETWSKLIGNDYAFIFDTIPKNLGGIWDDINISERNNSEFIDKVAKLFNS